MPLLSLPGVATAASPPGPIACRTPEGRRIPRAGRVTGLDVARALAVFGMVGAHFGGVPADVDPSPSSWLGVVNGRSAVLFAVLAGVSLALLTGRHRRPDRRGPGSRPDPLCWSGGVVFGIGIALEALDTDIDVILGVYAILFVLALPFLRWSPRRLLLAAAALAVADAPGGAAADSGRAGAGSRSPRSSC